MDPATAADEEGPSGAQEQVEDTPVDVSIPRGLKLARELLEFFTCFDGVDDVDGTQAMEIRTGLAKAQEYLLRAAQHRRKQASLLDYFSVAPGSQGSDIEEEPEPTQIEDGDWRWEDAVVEPEVATAAESEQQVPEELEAAVVEPEVARVA